MLYSDIKEDHYGTGLGTRIFLETIKMFIYASVNLF